MKKEYVISADFTLSTDEQGAFSAFDLSVAAALVMGARLVEVTEHGDAILEMASGKVFVSPAKDTATLSARQKEYEAVWFCPFTSKPIAQEIMRRFPMVPSAQAFRNGALVGLWVVESNTVYAAGNPQIAGIQHGADAWCITTSESLNEAITLNALMQAGCNRVAVFHFPAGQNTGQLLFVTPESALTITQDKTLAATSVFCPSLDKYAVVGAPTGELAFELENAKLQWQIQIARWSRETGQPVPQYDVVEPETEENDAPARADTEESA
ncbi:hypothetical protein UXN85_20550 [Enterobacter hormaechei]